MKLPQSGIKETEERKYCKARVRAVGIGGLGTLLVNALQLPSFIDTRKMAIDTDYQNLSNNDFGEIDDRILVGPEEPAGRVRHLPKNLNKIGLARNLFRSDLLSQFEIQKNIGTPDIVLLLAGLSRGAGTGITIEVAELLKSAGVLTVASITSPFAFEGRRDEIAKTAKETLIEIGIPVIEIPLEKILLSAEKGVAWHEVHKVVSNIISFAFSQILNVIHKSGPMRFNFDQIQAFFSEGGEVSLSMGECELSSEFMGYQKIEMHLVTNEHNDPPAPKRRMIVVHTGKKSSIRSINALMESLTEDIRENSDIKISIGISTDESMPDDRARITILEK